MILYLVVRGISAVNGAHRGGEMRKECESTRKYLRRYMSGHLFKTEQMRVRCHLKKCALCSSELQALKRAEETKRLLKDITPPEGVVQRVKEGVSGLSRIKKLLYRPLWLALIAASAAGAYFYIVVPIQRHFERQSAEIAALSLPEARDTAVSSSPEPAAQPSKQRELRRHQEQGKEAGGEIEPLTITITVEDEKAAVNSINTVMQGHAALKGMRFTDNAKEITGLLTSKDLLILFHRIESIGRIRYDRARFASFHTAELIPFVMKLRTAPSKPAPPEPVQGPVQEALPGAPAQ